MQHKGRIGLARVVKEIQEMHRHPRFADSNRQAHELRAFLPQASFSEIVQRIRFTPTKVQL